MSKAKTKKSTSNNISLADLFPMTSCQSIDPSLRPALSFNHLTDAIKPLADSITVPEFKTGVLNLGNICDKDTDDAIDENTAFNIMDKQHMDIINTTPSTLVLKVADQLKYDKVSENSLYKKLDTIISRLGRMNAVTEHVMKPFRWIVKFIPFIGKVLKIAEFIANACVAFECTKSPVKAFTTAFKLKKNDFLVELFEEGLKKLKIRLEQHKNEELKRDIDKELSIIDGIIAELKDAEDKCCDDNPIKKTANKSRKKKQPRDTKGRFLPFK